MHRFSKRAYLVHGHYAIDWAILFRCFLIANGSKYVSQIKRKASVDLSISFTKQSFYIGMETSSVTSKIANKIRVHYNRLQKPKHGADPKKKKNQNMVTERERERAYTIQTWLSSRQLVIDSSDMPIASPQTSQFP